MDHHAVHAAGQQGRRLQPGPELWRRQRRHAEPGAAAPGRRRATARRRPGGVDGSQPLHTRRCARPAGGFREPGGHGAGAHGAGLRHR
ncbi:hypothetical protein G6F57_023740 [Rhizopus arrhizus]|nr:hypothetical protein G6F57_023740 [Rhizopus arrhizus]